MKKSFSTAGEGIDYAVVDQYQRRRDGNYDDDDGDVKVDDRLSNGAAVGDGGGGGAVGGANIAEAAAHADGNHAVRRGRKGVSVPPGTSSPTSPSTEFTLCH